MSETKAVDVAKMQPGNPVEAPLYASQPAAGFPAPGDDLVEKALDINDLVVENPASTFFVRVSGDSMEGAGIFDGDVLVIDRAIDAKEGKIVVAAVYGELVVKRYTKVGNDPALVSENEAYAPIMVNESEDVYLWGTVVGSVRIF
ncbi:MAG: translesion error-prone DNA polymerase V autoproteolytic subunit [Patescibacteria group bacterium]